jgi:hypothetical protein
MRTAGIFLVLLFAGPVAPGFAHDPSSPELNSWFDNLKSSKGLCCSFADGFAVSHVDWDTKDGHYRVRLENNWIEVPNEALITEPNRVGRTMVWPLTTKSSSGASCRADWARRFLTQVPLGSPVVRLVLTGVLPVGSNAS